jgi:hypothetical protein
MIIEDFTRTLLVIVLLALIALSVGVAVIANQRNRHAFAWFAIALLGSPLMGILFLLALPIKVDPLNLNDGRENCQRCYERIRKYAKVCPFCGAEHTPNYS